MSKSVLIIGAGPAGITAGFELTQKGYEVTILEETSVIGGISKTVKHGENRMDMGGPRFFSKDERVMDWWFSIMPMQGSGAMDDILLNREVKTQAGGPNPEVQDETMLVRNRVSRIYYKNKFFDYPISMKWETIKNLGFFTTMKAGFSYLFSCVIKKEETNLENFYINRFGRVLYEMFFEGYTEKLWGRHPREISADWGAQRVKGLSILAILKDLFGKIFGSKKEVETSLIEEFYYPKFGPGHLWETAGDKIIAQGGQILFEKKVDKIETKDGKICAVYAGEEKFTADYILSSMPVKDLVEAMNDVPADTVHIASGLPYRDFVTVGLLLNKLNLKNQTKLKTLGDIVPDCWIYVQDVFVKLGRIQIFNNWSPYMVKNPEENVWIGLEYFCSEGDDFWNMSQEDCVAFAVDELIKMGVINHADEVCDCHRERVKKAYPAYFDTYQEMDKLIAYLDTFENLFCIGRNGQHRYNNMDHSMATAFETVANITEHKTDKSNIWSVNTDNAYHEKK